MDDARGPPGRARLAITPPRPAVGGPKSAQNGRMPDARGNKPCVTLRQLLRRLGSGPPAMPLQHHAQLFHPFFKLSLIHI